MESGGTSGDDQGWVDGLLVGTGSLVIPPDDNSEALDSHLKFTESGDGSWFTAWGTDADYYCDGDALYIADVSVNDVGRLQAIVESDSSETIKFHWKISGESGSDYLRFYIDSTLKDTITGEVDWQQRSYSVSSGIHTLKWVYSEGGSAGDNAWVDFVQWTGPSPQQDPSNWQAIDYKHDVYGRRSEKKVDGYGTRYLYDGPHVIAEYDGNNNLLRKYIYGPGIDQPVCMIEVAESNAAYYYHFDGLGSVVALSDSSGDTVQTYQYSVYGQVAVEDINHPNPYMFAGVRFDMEIGLYYNRARYYNPYTGRFLQTDPIGYGDGMNMYEYCKNNSLNYADPMGLLRTLGPNEIPDAIFISFPDKTAWGLIGEWDINDLCAKYCCEPGEILTANINGMVYYVEVHLDLDKRNKYEGENNFEIVKLNEEWKLTAYPIGKAMVANSEVVEGLDFSVWGYIGAPIYGIGLGLILTYTSSVLPGVAVAAVGAALFIYDTCNDPSEYVQIIAEAREPLEKAIRISDNDEFGFPIHYFCRWCQKYDCGVPGHHPRNWQK